ncbi:bifunctional UDP-sugar hydrolase/5'-nucleotidase [Frigoribacterium sp. PhB116]|uniref:bifunctional metallophosphatase/5'-nucleotidase n=1 Tax=Frigoribacterium sp. PhB116 TaxID=2485174 RepID=UPI00105F2004|nr:bifunctional UDP-sugar hydrolase/5'-nucleotidase [Frigoribacterium sp. PhB116]TDT62575.1 5'-nucleotidase [Frigoribacterium sp. PhB116]
MRPRPAATPQLENGGRRRRRAALSLVAVTTMGLGVLVAAPAAQAETKTIDVLGINDFHGRLERGTDPVAGAAAMAGTVNQFRAANPNALFVSSGDNIGASTFTSFIQDDEPTLDALNAMGLDVSTPGNHEFDKGQEDFNGRVQENSEFPYVNANIYETATGERAYDPYSVQDVDGVRVGFIGAITELMPELVSPAGIEGLEFRDITDSVNDAAAELTDGVDEGENGEADVIVLLVHEGNASADQADAMGDSDFADIALNVTPKVDAILSAHTHATYNFTGIVPTGGTKARPVVQTGSYGANLSHLSIQHDDVTGENIVTSSLVPLFTSTAAPDTDVAKIVSDAVEVARVEGRKPVGTITGDLRRAVQTNGSENRGGESTLGNLVADAQLAATQDQQSQIAFMNPGGLRADLTYASSGTEGDAEGVVTYQEAAAVQPFANTLVVSTLTGAQIRATLEQQWQPAGSSRPFLKLGVSKGLAYTYDPTAAAGSRVGTITLNGVVLDEAASYKVTVNSFLASGGDNFTALNGASAKADSGKIDLQSQVDYFTANPVVSPDLAQRAVGVTTTPAPAAGFAAGDEVTIALSSLLFSAQDATVAGDVSVSLDGVVLDSSVIDASVVDTFDEQGRATLTFAVPEGITAPTAGPVTRSLRVTVAGTGTAVDVPVVFAAAAAPVVVDPTPGDGDPGTPGTPGTGAGAAPGTGAGTGTGSGTGSTPRPAAAGDLAFTGSDAATTALLAALALMLAGAGVLTATRLRRRRELLAETTD